MHRPVSVALGLVGIVSLASPVFAESRARSEIDALIATHAQRNNLPEALVRHVVMKESRYNAGAVGAGGALGLMQIKYATARGLGYRGEASGLLDADTNLTYGVRYLAGAYRAANGNGDLAWSYYRSGYYYIAKRQRQPARTTATAD
jgi:soluble lytic murein transglycosylase-like protein